MYTKEKVLEIIDSLFHMYASTHRINARNEAISMLNEPENKIIPSGSKTLSDWWNSEEEDKAWRDL